MSKPLVQACLLAALLVGCSGSAGAVKFQATLDSITIEARPGQVVNRAFRLTLDAQEPRTQFKARVEDWWRSEDGKQSFFREPGSLARSCASWVKLNPVEAGVDPGGTLNIRITIAVPGDTKPGGYWCVLTVDEVPDPTKIPAGGVSVRFLTSISTGIFVSVPPVTRAARIVDVRILPDQAILELRNDGNCPLGVEGRFEFLRPGETKPTAIVRFPRGTLLPEPINTALFAATLPDAQTLPSGRYRVRAIFDIGLDHYLGGQKEMDVRRPHTSSAPIEGN